MPTGPIQTTANWESFQQAAANFGAALGDYQNGSGSLGDVMTAAGLVASAVSSSVDYTYPAISATDPSGCPAQGKPGRR
jgi:hypothetical protein